jgi:hypothetical protein
MRGSNKMTEPIAPMLMLMTIMRATAVQCYYKDDRSRLFLSFFFFLYKLLVDDLVYVKDSRKTSGRMLLTTIGRRYH